MWRHCMVALAVVAALVMSPAVVAAPERPKWLDGEDRELVDAAIARLEFCAATDVQKAMVDEMKLRCDGLFFLCAHGRQSRRALKALEQRRAVSIIAEALTQGDGRDAGTLTHRITAVEALARLDDKSVLPALVAALREPSPGWGTETRVADRVLKQKLVALVGKFTNQRFEVTEYDDRAQINKVIKAAERFMKNRQRGGAAAGESEAVPRVAETVTEEGQVRDAAVAQYLRYRKTLLVALRTAILSDYKGKPEDDPRASACFLLKKMRDGSHEVVEALISVIEKDFMGYAMKDIPYGKAGPMDALIAIGKPAESKLLEVIARDPGKRRRQRALACIKAIEGMRFTRILLDDAVNKAKTPASKANLKQAIEWLAAQD